MSPVKELHQLSVANSSLLVLQADSFGVVGPARANLPVRCWSVTVAPLVEPTRIINVATGVANLRLVAGQIAVILVEQVLSSPLRSATFSDRDLRSIRKRK